MVERSTFATLVIIVIVYPLLTLRQGLDLTDMGLSLALYRWIFDDPQCITFGLIWWGTDVIGGLWMKLFGSFGGVIAVKAGGVIITYVIAYFSFSTLTRYFPRLIALTAVVLCAIVLSPVTNLWLHYNTLSAMFYALIAYFLIKGLQEERDRYLWIAGLLTTVNVAVRFPNMTGMALAFVIVYYGMRNRVAFRSVARSVGFYLLGVAIAGIVSLLVMYYLGHVGLVIKSVTDFFSMSTGGVTTEHTPSHQLITLFTKNMQSGFHGLKLLLSLSIIPVVLWLYQSTIIRLRVSPKVGYLLQLLLVIGCLYVFLSWVFPILKAFSAGKFLPLITISLPLLMIFSFKRGAVHYLFVIATIVFFAFPIGSANSQAVAIHASWVGFALLIAYVLNHVIIDGKSSDRNKLFSLKNFSKLYILVTMGVIIYSATVAGNSLVYGESVERDSVTTTIDHPKLRGILTTQVKAKALTSVLTELDKLNQPGDRILVYNQIPIMHYLTDRKPYLNNPSPELYRRLLPDFIEKIESEDYPLPVAVRGKAKDIWFLGEVGTRITEYLQQNQYKLYWENQEYEIWLPPQMLPDSTTITQSFTE